MLTSIQTPAKILVAALLLIDVSNARAAQSEPVRFRDFKVYTTSSPDPKDPSRIVATMRLINAGAQSLSVRVALEPNAAAGFGGKDFTTKIAAAQEAAWEFDLRPPDGLKYEVLKGAISFGEESLVDRELFVAVQGPDPADLEQGLGRRLKVEKITAKAQVVGTHAPRTVESIRRSIEASKKAATTQPSLALVANGQSTYQIAFDALVAAPDAPKLAFEQWSAAPARTPPEKELAEAVADLERCVQIKTGATLPIVAGVSTGAAPAIRIRLTPAPAGWPSPDAYRLRAQDQDVVIEATTLDGLRNGVYALLTDQLDCHWFMPKQLGEEIVIPADKSISVSLGDRIESPSFSSCGGMSWGEAPKWNRQNRSVIDRGRMAFGHAWQGLVDVNQYPYDKFPDMWSRDRNGKVQVFDKGWSWTNFCSTNPEVIRIVAEKINAAFDANPDAIVMSLDPNDLAPMCQCDRCLAVDKLYGVTPQDDKQMSDRLLHFSKEIYDRLKPEHKEKFLGILAYGYQTRPPKSAVPHPYHATMVCDFPSYFDHTRPFDDPTSSFNRDFDSIVRGWGGKVKQLGFYDYYGHYNFFGPWGIIHKMREDLPAFKEMGGTFVMIEAQPNFAMHGLNLYVASRLVWNVNADADALVEEYVTKFYGPAADAMRDFYRTAERHYALTRPGTHAALRVARRPEFWQETDACLKRAEDATKGLSGADKRFADRIAFHRDGFEFGRRYFESESRFRGPRSKILADIPASIRSLREAKIEIDRLKAKYASTDPYWPTMIAMYFYPDVDGILKRLEELAAKAPTTKEAGQEIDISGD